MVYLLWSTSRKRVIRSQLSDQDTSEPQSSDEMTHGALEFSSTLGKIATARSEVTIEDLRIKDIEGRLEEHEFPVIGTHVDKRVIPGFMYRVRCHESDEYLFDGRALLLESIGRGYAKRITFESDSRNDPSNYFYSDSCNNGYAFAPVAVRVGDQLDVLPISGPHVDKSCGRLQVINITRHQRELETQLGEDRRSVCKKIEVHFTAKVLSATDLLLSCKVRSWTSVDCIGVCHLIKQKASKKAEITQIDLNFGSCLAGFKLVPPSSTSSRHIRN